MSQQQLSILPPPKKSLSVVFLVFLVFMSYGLIANYYLKKPCSSSTSLFQCIATKPVTVNPADPRLDNFRRSWLRQRRARVDWQSLVEYCKDDMAWHPVKWDKIHRSNASTSEIVFWDIRPAGEFSRIFIQSKTSDNKTKTIGGDTWRVSIRGPSKVGATMFDHHNGTYEALFLLTEPGSYELMVYLDYTLCDGFRNPPKDWFIRGNSEGRNQNLSMLGRPIDHLLFQSFNKWINITIPEAQLKASLVDKLKGLDSCPRSCKYLMYPFGRWTNETGWKPDVKESYNWSLPEGYNKTGTFWMYGDSVTREMFLPLTQQPLCTILYQRCRLTFTWMYPRGPGQSADAPDDDLDFQQDKIIGTIVKILHQPEMQTENSTLVINIGHHAATILNFTTFQKLIGDLIYTLKETSLTGKNGPKFKAKIIWKSATAAKKMKRTNATAKFDLHENPNSLFLTTQRNLLYAAYATTAMCEAGFDVLDLYHMTDSNPEAAFDGVHFGKSAGFFSAVENFLGKYKILHNKEWNGHQKERRCFS